MVDAFSSLIDRQRAFRIILLTTKQFFLSKTAKGFEANTDTRICGLFSLSRILALDSKYNFETFLYRTEETQAKLKAGVLALGEMAL